MNPNLFRLSSSVSSLKRNLQAVPPPCLMGKGSYAFAYHKMVLHLRSTESKFRLITSLN